jgi:hypothetical protein
MRELALTAEHQAGLASAGGGIFRFIMGLDAAPQNMSDADAAATLNDPFAVLLLRRGTFPQTLADLLAALDAVNNEPAGVPTQRNFLVGEGSQIAWTPATANLDRHLRWAIARSSPTAPGGEVDLLISTGAQGDPARIFLQVLAWDSVQRVFNYYMRQGTVWIWAGNSTHALVPGARGQGSFDSHVNGGMVMKELKKPWNNWNSQNAGIAVDVLAPNDPLRQSALFANLSGAEQLETSVIRPGVGRWNQARVETASGANGSIAHVTWFLRQLMTTTTVNLVSSTLPSRLLEDTSGAAPSDLDLPLTFFLNADVLFNVLALTPTGVGPPRAPTTSYVESLTKFSFALQDGAFRQPGDTFFAFLVPEPAAEDADLIQRMLAAGWFSRKFVASILMLDFPNPIFSTRRAQLLQYVTDTLTIDTAHGDIGTQIAATIVAAAPSTPPASPERLFAANWQVADAAWQATFTERIGAYLRQVNQRLSTAEGFNNYVRLAESRRREFAASPLREFGLLLPTTNIPAKAPLLELAEDGTVVEKTASPQTSASDGKAWKENTRR